MLSPYFKNLLLPVADEQLCDFNTVLYSYRYVALPWLIIKGVLCIFIVFLCGYKQTALLNHVLFFRKEKYDYRIKLLQRMIERQIGHPAQIERSIYGPLVISPEIFAKVPNYEQ